MPGALRLFLCGCFFATGASGLVYEIVWVRQLLLIVGTTTGAVSTVLAVFMAGLGLGAWLLGPVADRSRAPLKLYAWLEAAIGTYALLLPLLLSGIAPAYVATARGLEGSPAMLTALRVGLGFALLLPPTLCMGGTLPLLLRCLGRSEERLGRDLGALYGSNLAGAVCGSLLAGFAFIPSLGLHGATLVAVCVNLGVSLAALAVNARLALPGDQGSARAAHGASAAVPPPLRRLLWVVVCLSGVAGLAYEVLWTRILIFSLSSTVYSFTIILATFLTGLGLGSALFAFAETRWDGRRVLAAAQIGAGVTVALLAPAGAAATPIIQALSDRLGHSGGVFLLGSAASAALLILLPATLMGVVFPLSMRLLVDDLARAGRRVGAAYLANTLGSIVGSFGAGYLLLPLLGLKGALLFLAAAQLLAGWLLLPWCDLPAARRRAILGGTAALFALSLAASAALLRGPNPWDPLLRLGPDGAAPVIEAHHDGATASVSVVRRPTGRALHIDGFEATSTEARSAYMAMMTHLPMLLHGAPQRLLVICFGTGTTAGAGLLYPGVSIDAVDIDATVFRFAPFFRDVNRDVARSPRARLIQDDGRNFLLTTRELYDVITLEPMPPRFAGVVNLYSREYYALARSRLRNGGFVVQWLPMHLVDFEESLAILGTVRSVFPETTVFIHSGTAIVVARRDEPVRIDGEVIGRRLASPELQQDLARLGVPDIARLVDLFVAGPRAVSGLTAGARLITDDRPSLEYHRPRHRESLILGAREAEDARIREALFRAWLPEELPLAGFSPSEEASLRAARDAWTHALLGDLYASLGSWDEARVEYERGLGKTTGPRMRSLFLFGLALAARQQGRLADARRLLDEGLALAPENAKAQQLRQSLEASAPPRLP